MTESKGVTAVTMNAGAWDMLDASGHDLSHVGGACIAGASTYYCEACGAFIIVADREVALFHAVTYSTLERCGGPLDGRVRDKVADTLKGKLEALQEKDWKRLSGIGRMDE